jgi:hypothetical protein
MPCLRMLVYGSPTLVDFRFGDSTCPAGRTAVLAQQYFTASGRWATRVVRASFC